MNEPAECRVYISAGEASGDAHAANLAQALTGLVPGVQLEGTGGPRMAAAGVRNLHSIDGLGASGLLEAVRSVPHHVRLYQNLHKRFREGRYDLLVVVDYPGFHLRLASAAARSGVPVLYYIPPQLWAWGQGRAARLSRVAQRVAVVLPFEEEFFRSVGVNADFVGHPLLDAPAQPSRADARGRFDLSSRAPVLGLFPGSRPHEVERLWPAFRDAARIARQAIPDLEVLVATAPGCDYPDSADLRLWPGDAGTVMRAADAAICKSGTTTLEAALAGLPMVIAYRMHPWTHAIARRLVRVKRIGLANLVAGKDVAPELVQDDATPRHLAQAVLPLMDRDGRAAREQRLAFVDIRARLGTPGASARVAAMARELAA
ncbi:MAG: lipid-A-disaccharide synthase [Gemmatimonadetes bacterium]|nr:lipid-A-disaccharide synthase [Gemmatimonadota bacterium]